MVVVVFLQATVVLASSLKLSRKVLDRIELRRLHGCITTSVIAVAARAPSHLSAVQTEGRALWTKAAAGGANGLRAKICSSPINLHLCIRRSCWLSRPAAMPCLEKHGPAEQTTLSSLWHSQARKTQPCSFLLSMSGSNALKDLQCNQGHAIS